ncbi:GNAT family N-acetyltransferase [Paenibacillus marinisediminis]
MSNDIVHITEEELDYTIIFKEIAAKGKAYIAIAKCSIEDRNLVIDQAVRDLRLAGANSIYLTIKDERIEPGSDMISTIDYSFLYDSDMDYLSKDLSQFEVTHCSTCGISIEELTDHNKERYIELDNECFYHVPNSATCDDQDTARMMSDSQIHAGLLMFNGEPVGIVEISYKDHKAVLSSIGITSPYRGKGLGTAALEYILASVQSAGYNKLSLTVSSANPAAYRLYLKFGFYKTHTVSKWYRLEP